MGGGTSTPTFQSILDEELSKPPTAEDIVPENALVRKS
jgi:hypothetical protein